MPRHEPAKRQTAGAPPGLKVKMRIENGRFVPIEEEPDEAEAAEHPEDDPGPAAPSAPA